MNDLSSASDGAEILQLCLERDRLLCDPEFSRSPTMCKLLRFLIDHKLAGNTPPLKAYTIAVDALGRKESFDTQVDSYPRVQMGRLRRMLDNYYLREGGEYHLSIPYNKYEILLTKHSEKPEKRVNEHPAIFIEDDSPVRAEPVKISEPPHTAYPADTDNIKHPAPNNWKRFVIDAAIIILIIGGIYFVAFPKAADKVEYPTISISDASGTTNMASRETASTAKTYFQGALKRFEAVRVFESNPNQEKMSDYLLESTILDGAGSRIQFRLVENASKEVLWSDIVDTGESEDNQLAIARAAVSVASPYGAIAQHEIAKRRNDFSDGYACLLQFDKYLRYREKEIFVPVLECLEKSVSHYPDDAYLLSMYAFAQSISHKLIPGRDGEDSGMAWARAAEKLNSDSPSAAFAVARSAFFEGDCRTGMAWGKRAVSLNPLDSRISGYLSLYMIGCKIPEADRYATMALAADPNADLVIAAALAFHLMQNGDAEGAKLLSEQYIASSQRSEPTLELTYILATAKLGDKKEARRAWQNLVNRHNLPKGASPSSLLHNVIINPLLLKEVKAAFDEVDL